MRICIPALTTALCALILGCASVPRSSAPIRLETLSETLNSSVQDVTIQSVVQVRIEQLLRDSNLFEVTPDAARSWKTDELSYAIRVLQEAVYLSSGGLAPQVLESMETVFSELLARTHETPSDIRALWKTYVISRQFSKAIALETRHGEIDFGERVVQFVDRAGIERADPSVRLIAKGTRSLWRANHESAVLEREVVSIPEHVHVVAIVSLGCSFSSRALAVIQRDAELAALFGSVSWLIPPDVTLGARDVISWNRSFPSYALAYVHSVGEWPEIEYWDTPQFYFFARGRLVSSVAGWPREGRKAEMLIAYAAAKAAVLARD